jgi:dolichol-phosphate mannosyltransferase
LYNEEDLIPQLLKETQNSLQQIGDDFEIICVDDGSNDNTLPNLLKEQKNNSKIKIIELSRNFGHQAAYTAGLMNAKGETIGMIDGDLQDPPSLIPKMYEKLNLEKLDIVYGKRIRRNETFHKKFSIKLFHIIFNKLSNINAPVDVGNFSLMNRQALNAFLLMKEKNRYLPGLRYFIGFKHGYVAYNRPDREIGEAKMSFFKLVKLAFDAIFSFSKIPLKISLLIGILGLLFSLAGAGIVMYKKVIGEAITGWSSMMLSIFFLGSVQLLFLGIIGEYIYRIYTEVQNRPIYIIKRLHD